MSTCDKLDRVIRPCLYYTGNGFCKLPSKFRCEEYMKKESIRLSYSSMSSFLLCRRKFYWSYMMGLELIELPEALRLGKAFHEFLEKFYITTKGLTAHIENIVSNVEAVKLKDLEFGKIQGELLILGFMLAYDELCSKMAYKQIDYRLGGVPEHFWEWVSEDELITLNGYVDLYHKNSNYIAEFKYTSNPTNYNIFSMRNQLALYFLGTDCDKAIVRTFRKPYSTRKKDILCGAVVAKVKEDVLARPKYYINDTIYYRQEFETIIKDEVIPRVKLIVSEIRNCLKSDDPVHQFYQNIGYHCDDCMYIHICKTGGVPESLYQKRGGSKQ